MRNPLLILVAIALLWLPVGASAQGVLTRSVNLTDGWVGEPGTLHFNFDHRFRLISGNVLNSPSFFLGASVPGNLLLGGWYASESGLVSGEANEWEALARWAPPVARDHLGPGLTLGYNSTAGSVDGELALRAPIRLPEGSPIDSIGLLGAIRAFSDVADSGDGGWFAGGGVVLHLGSGISLAGDGGRLTMDGPDVREVWGAAVQFRIPTTPHTFSIKASNTNSATLQGASIGRDTRWGFEFTIPITLSRYFPGSAGADGGGETEVADPGAEQVEVAMNDALDFVPQTLRIRAGQTVTWRNVGEIAHTVTADPSPGRVGADQVSLPAGVAPFDSGLIRGGESFSYTFSEPGEYRYICVPHIDAAMVGTIIVEE